MTVAAAAVTVLVFVPIVTEEVTRLVLVETLPTVTVTVMVETVPLAAMVACV